MSARASAPRRGLAASAAGVSTPSDKHYRRSDVRPGKRRRAGQLAWRTVRVLLVPSAVTATAVWLAISMAGSPFLHVDRLLVRGNARLSAGEVEALVAGMRGESILALDFEQYERRLMESAWVASVSLSRVLPSTVEIRITERVPMAIARLVQQLYLIDKTGVIIDAYGPQYREFDLPIVDGLIDAGVSSAAAVNPARLQATAGFFAALVGHPALRPRISQIDVANARDLVVLLDDDPARLHLGEAEFVARIQTYLELAPTLHEQLADIDYVDLRFGDRVFVRSRGQTASIQRTAHRRP